MKADASSSRKAVVRLASVAPQPDPVNPSDVTSQQRANDVDEVPVATMVPVQESSPVFELLPIAELPSFDAAKTLKTVLLTQDQIHRVNAFRAQYKYVIAVMLQLGNLLMLLTTAAPQRIGSVMAVLAPFLQFPGMMFILCSLRIEMLILLLGTYDFWYFTINNLMFCVCFMAMFQDIRIISVIVGCVIVQISIAADALVGDRRQIFLSSLINCGTHFAMLVVVFLKLVDDNDTGETLVFGYSSTGYGFAIRDTLMNTQLNMVLLFGRLVYRNWVAMREQSSAKTRRVNSLTSYVPGRRRCVSYYCTVALRPKSSIIERPGLRGSSTGSTASLPRMNTVGSTADGQYTRSRSGSVISMQAIDRYHISGISHAGLRRRRRTRIRNLTNIQLQFVAVSEDINAYKTLIPGFGRLLDRVLGSSGSHRTRQALLGVFHTLGCIGMSVLVLGALLAWISEDQNLDNLKPGLALTQDVAFFASLIFCGVFFASYQRQLLKRLYSSFNFLFLSTKLTVASIALCQFFDWDSRVIWVWGAWLWMHWAITLDALPPSTIRLLSFQRSTLMLFVLVFELTGLIILSLELFVLDRWNIPYRVAVDQLILGRHVRVSTLSALVSRLWSIFLWDCKLIWSLCAALRRQRHRRLSATDTTKTNDDDEGERLLLTGRVEYFYEWASHNRPRNTHVLLWSKSMRILGKSLMRRRAKANLVLANP